jgi:phosphatidylserine decarboxylase
MSVGHSPGEAQWTPDMRKSDEEITEVEKEEAMRRIQGSEAVEESPDDSADEGGHLSRRSRRPTLDTLAASAM